MLVGRSAVMHDLRARIGRVASTGFTVLVEGESGAGKELVAREIHAKSPRRLGPFVAVNCAAIVETLVEAELFGIEERAATGVRGRRGKFELADQGTLFLDEVADLSLTAQAKLLRVLQDMTVERVGGFGPRVVDSRIVVATNRSLREMVQAGRFRADLYYRLAGVEVTVPALRARREDIPLLIEHFLAVHGRSSCLAVAAEAIEVMMVYDWPGNVRQLARVMERAIALAAGPEVAVADLPDEVCRQPPPPAPAAGTRDDSLRAWSGRYARLILERCRGNKRHACDILDISYHTLRSHLRYEAAARARTEDEPDVIADLRNVYDAVS